METHHSELEMKIGTSPGLSSFITHNRCLVSLLMRDRALKLHFNGITTDKRETQIEENGSRCIFNHSVVKPFNI